MIVSLEEALIWLYDVQNHQRYFTKCSNIDSEDLETLVSFGLAEKDGCLYRRTALGDKLVTRFIGGWNKRSYDRPFFKEQPWGELKDFLDREYPDRENKVKPIQDETTVSVPVPSMAWDSSKFLPWEASTPLSVERVPMVASEVKSKIVDVDVSTGIPASRKDVLRQTKELKQCMEEHKKEILNTVKDWIQGEIDTLDKIPPLDKTSERWLKVSDYAKKVDVTTDYLRNERSKVHTGKSKGIENRDSTAGIHGKHVWRKDGTDDNGNPVYWYYLQRSI